MGSGETWKAVFMEQQAFGFDVWDTTDDAALAACARDAESIKFPLRSVRDRSPPSSLKFTSDCDRRFWILFENAVLLLPSTALAQADTDPLPA